MTALSPSQQRQLKRLENHHAELTKVHDELRRTLDDLQETFDGQQALIDALANTVGEDHREEIAALTRRLERVTRGAQAGRDQLAMLAQQLEESRANIDALTSTFQERG